MFIFSTESPNDIVCPIGSVDGHKPNCTMCAKGFALITKIQEKVKEKLRELTGGTASFDPIPENEPLNNYRSMVVSDLKELLEERDLSKAGRKNDFMMVF